MSEKCPLAIGNGGVGFSCAECDATEYSCHPSHNKPKITKKKCPFLKGFFCVEEECTFWEKARNQGTDYEIKADCIIRDFMLRFREK